MKKIRTYAGVAVLIIGVAVIAMGGFFVSQGMAARDEIKASMVEEQVTTKINDVEVPVNTQETAMNQANLIKSHTLERFGPWSSMERDDPNRATMLDGLTLRNSLYLGRMGLDVADLVMGLGAIFMLIGTGMALGGVVLAHVEQAVTEPAKVKDLRVPAPEPSLA